MKRKITAVISTILRIFNKGSKTKNKKTETTYCPEKNENSVVYGPPPIL